jgi:putative ABC transport system substrate-binding protein
MLAGGLAAAPLIASAQAPQRLRRIAWLRWDTVPDPQALPSGQRFRERMAEFGWIEGGNYQLDIRYADGDSARANALVAEMLAKDAEVIVASSTPAVRAVAAATRTVPIVMAPAVDPVANGFVPQLSRPGGNVTGVMIGGPEVTAKQIELLRETVPGLTRIAFLGATRDPAAPIFAAAAARAAQAIGIELTAHFVEDPRKDLAGAFAAIARSGVHGVLVQPLFVFQRDVVAALALEHRLPAVSELRPLAQSGLLFTYGTSNDTAAAQGAEYVDRILRGARPGDLPVEGARRIELVFNLKTARALGLVPPQMILQRADEIIE